MPELSPLPPNYDQQGLAAARTRMANERTFLTYVRTSLAMLGFGLALIQLHPVRAGSLGYWAVGAAGVVLLTGWLRFRMRQREIEDCRIAVNASDTSLPH
ncbi:YidH family protein [Hymenobacter sp. 102]|uniref:YidH family protein n=1 Tax=Hymenobacter sp. 102 TaxID=3403152 RepID=UPI003CEB2F81